MNKGEKIVCRSARGYDLTEGKTYEVVQYDEPWQDKDSPGGFTWPAYVHVINDSGKQVAAHASRFARSGEVPV